MYVVVRKFFDVLPAIAARGSQLVAGQDGHHVDLLDLATTVLDHFGDRGLLGAQAADGLLDVTAGVELAVAAQHARAHCEIGVGTVSSRAGLHGQLVHLEQVLLTIILVLHFEQNNNARFHVLYCILHSSPPQLSLPPLLSLRLPTPKIQILLMHFIWKQVFPFLWRAVKQSLYKTCPKLLISLPEVQFSPLRLLFFQEDYFRLRTSSIMHLCSQCKTQFLSSEGLRATAGLLFMGLCALPLAIGQQFRGPMWTGFQSGVDLKKGRENKKVEKSKQKWGGRSGGSYQPIWKECVQKSILQNLIRLSISALSKNPSSRDQQYQHATNAREIGYSVSQALKGLLSSKELIMAGRKIQLDAPPKDKMKQLKSESISYDGCAVPTPSEFRFASVSQWAFKKKEFYGFWPLQWLSANFELNAFGEERKGEKGESLGRTIGRVIKDYINRSFSVGNIIVFKIVLKNMAYYIFINPGNNGFNAIEQFPSYYSSMPSVYQTTDDFVSPSLYTFSWNQTEFLKPSQYTPTLITAVTAENGFSINQTSSSASEKPKKKVQKTLEKEILSAKKNSQSNIINQFYSYFGNREKSEKILERCYQLMGKTPEQFQKISSYFYTAIRLINAKRGRKYVNVAMFLRFFNPEQLASYLPEMEDKLASCELLNMDELCEIIRRCCKHFLKNISPSAIMTSKRISIVSKEEHLKKRRKFLRTMLEI